jgi:5-methylcytosine-specific restriction endonuclease McrA
LVIAVLASNAKHPENKKKNDRRSQNGPAGRARNERYRARRRGVVINDFTREQWIVMQALYDYRCVYCGKRRKGKLGMDHILALSRGGQHTAMNIVPACWSCNSKKRDREVLCPVQPVLLLPM